MTKPSPYFLSYRNEEPEEHQRLNSQHHVIQHAILGGHLIHASVKFTRPCISIADIACGTGIWLEDVRKSLLGSEAPILVGFDVNSHGFDTSLAPAIKLVQHDCTEAFPTEYLGQFDLVNIRGLAFAVPQDDFARLLANAVHLLRPGGYIQWLETDTRLFQQFPVTSDFSEAISLINEERKRRGLVQYLPRFMLEQMLKAGFIDILQFNLLPSGISRDPALKNDDLNRRFSETVLESLRAALAGLVLQGGDSVPGKEDGSEASSTADTKRTRHLVDAIDASKQSPDIIAGGIFPFLVARRLES